MVRNFGFHFGSSVFPGHHHHKFLEKLVLSQFRCWNWAWNYLKSDKILVPLHYVANLYFLIYFLEIFTICMKCFYICRKFITHYFPFLRLPYRIIILRSFYFKIILFLQIKTIPINLKTLLKTKKICLLLIKSHSCHLFVKLHKCYNSLCSCNKFLIIFIVWKL